MVQKQDKYENEAKKNIDEFKNIKSNIYHLFTSLDCDKDVTVENKLLVGLKYFFLFEIFIILINISNAII